MPEVRKIQKFFIPPPYKRTAVYARISRSQRGTTGSIDSQVSVLVDYIDDRFNLKLEGIYVDVGSGRNADSRKELKRLIQKCMDGEVDMIITKSASRFGRNTVDMLSICRRLTRKGIDVFFLNDNIHSLSSDGELSLTLLAAVAEGESRSKSESIKWGINRRAEHPDAAIYSRKCYGYTNDKDGELVINDDEAEVVRQIFEMYISGKGSVSIKNALEEKGIPSPRGGAEWPKATIEKILRNEKYCGDAILYKTYIGDFPEGKRIKNVGEHDMIKVTDHHEAIIDREVFDSVQKMIMNRSRKKSVY